jgi:hypothetical protein
LDDLDPVITREIFRPTPRNVDANHQRKFAKSATVQVKVTKPTNFNFKLLNSINIFVLLAGSDAFIAVVSNQILSVATFA